ncbi:Ankyrin Repeat Protein [Seminavis robusta]|uniref:Poly [ADP-ribose] polymerase n=1 Tax=Seminavis robusta TaxID=568900 RepID=A0A9N8EJS3_9STRA|nr:Ankyrin Repeat Protein [Seminavis robusta]|eukprot:Sro1071_g237900.1 Ankyrin Repeat Protein (374) ;mRNA; r:12860-13981
MVAQIPVCHSDRNTIVLLHARTLALTEVSCERLQSRGVDLAQHLGYRPNGIVKGSEAARAMSAEAKRSDGRIRSVEDGGVVASLQSIGAFEDIKPLANKNVAKALRKLGMLRDDEYLIENGSSQGEPLLIIELPSYFRASVGDEPTLQDDYKVGGYNYFMAETMLNESTLAFCKQNPSGCPNFNNFTTFKVRKLQRLENVDVFEQYKRHETMVARKMKSRGLASNETNSLPNWLKKLSQKNGLSSEANGVYLLHGTKSTNLDLIVEHGLKTKFSLDRGLSYGKGLYFTDNACKASQFTARDGVILVCRVVLGRQEILPRTCPRKLFPDFGYDSAMAKRNHTDAPHAHKQLHNEYIIYDDCSCYPEFAIHFDLS